MLVPESADERFVRALGEADAFRSRRSDGTAEGLEEWLAAHEDLRELLAPMLEDDGETAVERTAPVAAAEAPGAAADAVATADLRRFAHFRILGSLGGGGMGDVYLALDEKLGRKVALKVIRPEALWSQDAKLRFHREALAVGRLDHPNICRLYEAGEHEGWPFMALQFVEGETLAQRLEQARAACRKRDVASSSAAPVTRAHITAIVALIEQVARALHHAHGHGLVHRDVKPGNIMIGADGRPVVLDFGLVRDERNLEASLASSRCGVGTPLYMSPEQIARTSPIDARTDVYSLGVTLYECLTHARPFDAPTEAELADQILTNRYTDPRKHNRQLPPELGLVIACALDRDPERRYRTALAMAEDLRRVIDLQPVAARPIGKALRLRRWLQRNPVLLAVGTLAGTALVGLVIAAERAIEAKQQEGIASANADETRTSLDRFGLLADVLKLQEAKALEPTLHPALPETAPAMHNWLRERGEPLHKRLPTLEAALVELRKKAQEPTPEAAALLDAGGAPSRSYTFADGGDRFLHQTLSGLIDGLHAFAGEHGELSAVRRRLVEAESVRRTTIEDHQASWDAAIAAIAQSDGAIASHLYDHLVLEPQVGLVPIGMDPESKLWEFAHVASGAVARRHPQHGQLVLEDETGIVFVLLPAGRFWMGAQKEDPLGPNYDPAAQPDESPVHEVALGPFFLGKYEMTQAQWRRLAGGETPSHFKAGTVFRGQSITLRNPVECVNWSMCDTVMARQGLLLPTEAQWEYGCRAGSTTPWWTGQERESLRTPRLVANLADRAAVRAEMVGEPIDWPELDDGYAVHAPVGSLPGNRFGLHDLHGNVVEWCRDSSMSHAAPTQPGDEPRPTAAMMRPCRDGDFQRGPGAARSARRMMLASTTGISIIGLRPARDVVR